MARAYSIDLRERVVEYVSDGGDRDEASTLFNIGIATVQRWMTLHKKTGGDLSPKPMGSRPWKLDGAALAKYVEKHGDSTLQEIANHFNAVPSGIYYALNRCGITRKKNHAVRRARRRKAGRISG